ncbi:hypothetical protein [Amycolatopsis sp. WGS_07]
MTYLDAGLVPTLVVPAHVEGRDAAETGRPTASEHCWAGRGPAF